MPLPRQITELLGIAAGNAPTEYTRTTALRFCERVLNNRLAVLRAERGLSRTELAEAG